MSQSPKSEAPADIWQQIAQLYAPVASLDQTLMESAVFMSEMNLRLENAVNRKQQLTADAPQAPAMYDPSAVAALADDPMADIDETAMLAAAKAKATHDEANRVWQAKIGMVDEAIAQLDAATAALAEDHARYRQGRDAVWSEFCQKARGLLCAEFERRFLDLRADTLDVIDYLERLTDGEGNSVIKTSWMRPDVADVKITKYKRATHLPEGVDDDGRGAHEGGQRWVTEYLYPAPEVRAGAQQRAEFYTKVAERFMAAVKANAPAPADKTA